MKPQTSTFVDPKRLNGDKPFSNLQGNNHVGSRCLRRRLFLTLRNDGLGRLLRTPEHGGSSGAYFSFPLVVRRRFPAHSTRTRASNHFPSHQYEPPMKGYLIVGCVCAKHTQHFAPLASGACENALAVLTGNMWNLPLRSMTD